jgi:hypothetical protein
MSDLAELVLAGVASVIGHVATWLVWRELIRRERRLPPPPPVPRCICGDPLGLGRCPRCGA